MANKRIVNEASSTTPQPTETTQTAKLPDSIATPDDTAPEAQPDPQIDPNSPQVLKLMQDMQKQIDELTKKLDEKQSQNPEKPLELKSNITDDDRERHMGKADFMKAHLAKQPKVKILVPLEGKELRGKSILPVTLNGYRLNVPKGVYVEVPEQIGNIIMDSLNQTEEALDNDFRLDRADVTPAKQEALS